MTDRDLHTQGGHAQPDPGRKFWAPPLSLRRSTVALLLLALCAAVAYGCWQGAIAYGYWGKAGSNYFDLTVYRLGGHNFFRGAALYHQTLKTYYFTYPPFAALLFYPISLMNFVLSRDLLLILDLGLLVLSVARAGVIAQRRLPRWSWLVLGLLLIPSEPTAITMMFGQINILITALIIWDLSLSDDNRFKGVMIGVASGLKLTPLIFIPYLFILKPQLCAGLRSGIADLARGHGQGLGGIVSYLGGLRVAAVACLTFAATVAIPFALHPSTSITYWVHGLFINARRTGNPQYFFNQSLNGLRLHYDLNTWPFMLNLVELMIIVWAVWIAIRLRDGGDPLLAFVCLALCSLIVSPISWEHHWEILLPAFPYLILGTGKHSNLHHWTVRILTSLFYVFTLSYIWLRVSDYYGYTLSVGPNLVINSYIIFGIIVFLALAAQQLVLQRREIHASKLSRLSQLAKVTPSSSDPLGSSGFAQGELPQLGMPTLAPLELTALDGPQGDI